MEIGLLSFIGCCSSHHLKGIRLLLMYWLLSLPLFEGYRVVVYLLVVVAQLCVGVGEMCLVYFFLFNGLL